MLRSRILLIGLVLVLGACSDESAATTTSPTTTVSVVTTTQVAETTTVATTVPETTSTSFLPLSQSNPEMEAVEGIWTRTDISSWTIRLDGHSIVAGGNPTNLVILGTWEIIDTVMTIRGVNLGFGGCGDIAGQYTIAREADLLTITLIEDACEARAKVMPGPYSPDNA